MSTEAFESVKIARDSKRPTGLDYINAMFSEFSATMQRSLAALPTSDASR